VPTSDSRPRITVVDDDLVTCELLCEVFAQEGFDTEHAQSGESALAAMAASRPDVLISDIRMKTRLDGLALLELVRHHYPSTPVVLITAFGSIETAIQAIKAGAFDYVSKPFEIGTLVSTVRRALSIQSCPDPQAAAQDEEPDGDLAGVLIGRSPAMLDVYKLVARVADSPAAVLITGESGSGKELVARAIHMHGTRHGQPFVAVNCGALPDTLLESELFGHVRGAFTGAVANRRGLFEQAGEGTVFLDEVSEMSPALQVKLLRVLQEREVVPLGGGTAVPVRARVIAASNMDLERMSAGGGFRRDLWYRLNVINIDLPPLRARADDIPLLVRHFLRKYAPDPARPPAASEAAVRLLAAYSWPGNVRELENMIERAVTLSPGRLITEDDLPAHIRQATANQASADALPDVMSGATMFAGLPTIDELECRYVRHVLNLEKGNRKAAAKTLGINRRTLYRMAARFGLQI
jgi:two-component system, NtrC family, response regulator AtoC